MFGGFGDISKAMESIQKYGAIFEEALGMVRDLKSARDADRGHHDECVLNIMGNINLARTEIAELRAEIAQLREGK